MVALGKHVRPHLKRLEKHHKRHKHHILTTVHMIRRHPAFYKPGFKPSRSSAIPRSFPRMPAGLNKRGQGMWGWAKKGWNAVKKVYHKHKATIKAHVVKHGKKLAGKAWDYVKKRGTAYAKEALGGAKKWGTSQGQRVISSLKEKADANISKYTAMAEKKVESIRDRAEATIDKYTGK